MSLERGLPRLEGRPIGEDQLGLLAQPFDLLVAARFAFEGFEFMMHTRQRLIDLILDRLLACRVRILPDRCAEVQVHRLKNAVDRFPTQVIQLVGGKCQVAGAIWCRGHAGEIAFFQHLADKFRERLVDDPRGHVESRGLQIAAGAVDDLPREQRADPRYVLNQHPPGRLIGVLSQV